MLPTPRKKQIKELNFYFIYSGDPNDHPISHHVHTLLHANMVK